ncbi:2-dehydro-3-deoxygalactonokinase [Arenibacterium sp. CAU 1754]
MNVQATWIAADWGSTRLRIWALDASGAVIGESVSEKGMSQLHPDEYEAAFLELAEPFLGPDENTPVIVCGMAGARQGWIEAPYAVIPCHPAEGAAVTAPTRDPRVQVRILPGLCQLDPPDVMRGEETQLAGYMAGAPEFSGVICLPGTHTKWVRVAKGKVVAFHTVMTGELFALLSEHSVLRHSLDADWNTEAFRSAAAETLRDPARLTAGLFPLRAQSLVGTTGPGLARARLSGLLIGAELAAMRSIWQEEPVTLIGSPDLVRLYETALTGCGVTVTVTDGAGLTLTGLKAAYTRLRETDE